MYRLKKARATENGLCKQINLKEKAGSRMNTLNQRKRYDEYEVMRPQKQYQKTKQNLKHKKIKL